MSKKFDEYLNKGGFTDEDRKAAQVEKSEAIARDQSPSDTQNSYTPDTKDAGKQSLVAQTQTVEQVKDSMAKYKQRFGYTPKEPEQEPEL